jgi:hypothetical protein
MSPEEHKEVRVPTEVIFACAAVCNVPVMAVDVMALRPVIVVDRATSSALTVMFEPAPTFIVLPLLVRPAPDVI